MRLLIDKFGRVHDYLRISLTDKCNLNCIYCSPVGMTEKLSRNEIFSYDELIRLIRIFVLKLGIKKIRLTGGEPLARKNILTFFEALSQLKIEHPFELCMTTNGTLLENNIETLNQLGLDKLNISLDSLQPEKFVKITGKDNIHSILRAIDKAESIGYSPIKINNVVMRGINDDEVLDFVDYAKDRNMNVRFIEFMPFSNNGWSENAFINYKEIKRLIETKYEIQEVNISKEKVAKDFCVVGHKGTVSFITSISDHFCHSCNRLRITASGNLKLCLFTPTNEEINLKYLLRNPLLNDSDIAEVILESMLDKKYKHDDVSELIQLERNNMLSIGG